MNEAVIRKILNVVCLFVVIWAHSVYWAVPGLTVTHILLVVLAQVPLFHLLEVISNG